jgi:hypothetical protein
VPQRALCALLILALVGWPAPVPAQGAATDPEVVKGIKQVEDGEYDAAIITLDSASRRLAASPTRVRELSQAYLYLGIAYVGKGQEAAARARFREALGQIKDLSLSADKFPPKVINLFEAAKEELAKAPPAPATGDNTKKKGGGGKTALIVLGVAAAGGGVALAAGGGGGGGGGPDATPTPDTRRTETFTGRMTLEEYCRGFNFVVQRNGTLDARLTWTEANVELKMELFDVPDENGNVVTTSNRLSQTAASLSFVVVPKTYSIALCHTGNSCGEDETCGGTYMMTVTYP